MFRGRSLNEDLTSLGPPRERTIRLDPTPYGGESCESLVRVERGGDPFWIPRACLVGVDQAVEIVSYFLLQRERSPAVSWCYWHELQLSDSYPEP